jgi:hypothetical protein
MTETSPKDRRAFVRPAMLLWLAAIGFAVQPARSDAGWKVTGGMAEQHPRTTGPLGHGNHGLHGTAPDPVLNQWDRRDANWDGAPGGFLELNLEDVHSQRLLGLKPLRFSLGAYGRVTRVDSEYNETQQDWTFWTGTLGLRGKLYLRGFEYLKAFGGVGAGAGHIAERTTWLSEYEFGIEWGPLAVSKAVQFLEDGNKVDHGYVGLRFDLGDRTADEPRTPLSYSFVTRLAKHPGRKVKPIHQSGFLLGYALRESANETYSLELELLRAPVESLHRRPLNESVGHNYRTRVERFWALYLAWRRSVPGVVDFVDLALGGEAYFEQDGRVNPGLETGWFFGQKTKLGLGFGKREKTRFALRAIGGADTFGINYGAEATMTSTF